jgi:hypothetical protein
MGREGGGNVYLIFCSATGALVAGLPSSSVVLDAPCRMKSGSVTGKREKKGEERNEVKTKEGEAGEEGRSGKGEGKWIMDSLVAVEGIPLDLRTC